MKGFIIKILLISIFLIAQLSLFGAKKPFNMDSLKVVIMHATKDKTTENLLRMAARTSHKDFNTALAYIYIARDQAAKAKNKKDLFNINREMGFVFEENNHLQNALNSYNGCMDIAQDMNDNTLKLTIYTDLAIVYEKMSKYAIAKNYHLKAIDLAEREQDIETVENGYHGLGSLYETVGEYEKAIDYYLKSLNIAEQRKSTEGVVITLQSIANTYRHLKHEKESLETIKRSYDMAVKLDNKKLIASTLYDFGHILTSFGKYQEALTKQKSSLMVYRQSEDGISISRGLVNIAEIYTHLELYNEAESYFMECFNYEKYLSTLENARLHNRLGKLYLKQNKIDTAEVAFKKSLIFSKKGDYRELTQQNNYDLYKINQNKGNDSLALRYLETYTQLSDYVLNEQRTDRITELQFKFDVEKNDKEHQALMLRQNKMMFAIFSITLILLIVGLGYMVKMKEKNNMSLRKKSEEIESQNIRLAENNEVLSQFVYVAAHDLKEPLRNVGSFVSLIQKKYGKEMNEEANEYMGFVTSGVMRMNNLLGDLLEYSRITSSVAENERTTLDDILKDVTGNLREKIISNEAVLDFPSEKIDLKISRVHLLQLMQNLIGNGLKFIPEGRQPIIKVETKLTMDAFVISVSDNGIGINENYSHKVFNLFHQLNKRAGYEGTGIGLTICKNIVDKYNGKIWFDSVLTEGTTFHISLPPEIFIGASKIIAPKVATDIVNS